MSYNFSKFPPDVSRLFKPRPPLEYKKPVDYPPEQRQTCPHIKGVSQLLESSLQSYLDQFPQGSENTYLQEYEKASSSKAQEIQKLETKVRKWNPSADPNIKDTDPYRTVFVGRLPYDSTEMELQREFSKFGDIERIRVVRDKITNASKGYGFVMFVSPQSSKTACREIGIHRGLELKGRRIIVDIERGRTVKYFKPRRLGGGLGGRGYTKSVKTSRIGPSMTRKFDGKPALPRPAYNGPSRFSGNTSAPPSRPGPRYGGNSRRPGSTSPSVPAQVTTSYRSRNSRGQETRSTRFEEPDY